MDVRTFSRYNYSLNISWFRIYSILILFQEYIDALSAMIDYNTTDFFWLQYNWFFFIKYLFINHFNHGLCIIKPFDWSISTYWPHKSNYSTKLQALGVKNEHTPCPSLVVIKIEPRSYRIEYTAHILVKSVLTSD